MAITVTPTNATLGAVVTGVDLAQLDDATWSQVHTAFLEYGVLVFPGQHLDDDAQAAFARRFGETERLSPRQKGASVPISNQKPDGSLAQPDEYHYQILRGNEGWHTDSTYMPLASKVAMLTAIELPPEGGDTEFADMRAAWDALDAQTKTQLEGLSAYHSLYYSQAQAGFFHKTDNLYGLHDKGAPLRPLIKTHSETGRKSIYTGRHAYGIPGMSEQASELLLKELLENACQPPRVYTHKWQVGDTVVWDNRCLMHRARPYDAAHARVLRGTRISGDAETELAPTFADERADAFSPSTSNESPLAV
ncbi:MAG: TauD/TfdA family dioxygenase [Gammaproteobacteria bacterium]|nr:TauD/TfdA family dioxygenase [Gammaproteobacteria bacterium]